MGIDGIAGWERTSGVKTPEESAALKSCLPFHRQGEKA
jgi:hypothetical protein